MKVSTVFIARLLCALIQAAALYWLTDAAVVPRAWPATEPLLFVPLLLVFSYAPLLALLGFGQIRARPLAIWLALAGIVIAGLGYHDSARGRIAPFIANGETGIWPWIGLWTVLTASLFIAHVLVVDSVIERRFVPSYARHFDTAWKQGVQAVLAVLFVGIFWGVLHLGAGLFKLLDVDYFQRLIQHRWFAYPATTLALAVSIHVTDVQPTLIRGARSLALTLLSWLLPLLVVILVGFLLSLPFISLVPLWKTHFATSLLLIASGLLVFLINCSYQDGAAERTSSRIKQAAGTIGAIALVPLVGLAIWALALRVGQYGWSVERILAAACIIVAACYAIGYSSAVFWTPSWLKRIEIANFVAAYISLLLVVALFSPLADPARLMVADQVARLKSGAVTVEKFDFVALKFEGARWGADALTALSHDTEIGEAATVKSKAEHALAMTNRWSPNQAATAQEFAGHVTVYPAGRTLPADFYETVKTMPFGAGLQMCFTTTKPNCIARFISFRPGDPEFLLFMEPYSGHMFEQDSTGHWIDAGQITGATNCASVRKAIETGDFQLDPNPRPDIVIGDQRLVLVAPLKPCPAK